MALAQLFLDNPINEFASVGDVIYYVDTSSSGGFDVDSGEIIKLGEIVTIVVGTAATIITVDAVDDVDIPSASDFLLFSKDRRVNETSLLGYFADFKFENNSRDKAELFIAGCEVTPNS